MWIRTSSMSPYWLFVFNFIALAYNFIVLVCTTSTLGHLLPVRHQPDTLQYLGVCTGTHAEETTPSPCWYVLYGRPWVFLRRFTFTESMNLSLCKITLLKESVTLEKQKKKTIKKLYIFGHSSIYTIWFWYWNYVNCKWSFRLFE